MKTLLYTLTATLLLCTSLVGQVQEAWVVKYKNDISSYSSKIVVDADGNSYILTRGYVPCDTYTIAIIKHDKAGNFLWRTDYFSGEGLDANPSDVALDSEGNTCVTGIEYYYYFFVCVIVKFDSEGNVLWSNQPPIMEYTVGSKIIVDREDNIYVLGVCSEFAYENCIFIIKYKPDGTQDWLEVYDPEDEIAIKDFKVDDDGNVYVLAYQTALRPTQY